MMSGVLSALFEFRQPVSTMQIAKFMGISWKTARDNLEALFKLGMVQRGKVGENKRIFWKSDESVFKKVKVESREFKEKEAKLKIKEIQDKRTG